MSAIITITNQKGGVGKTTTSSALMDGLQSRGARVLGVDLDPQGSLGFCLGLDIENCATVYDVLKGTAGIHDVIMKSDCGDILPSNILLSAAELEFNRPGREFLLKNALAEVEEEYDYIIIDTPPALNVLTVNAYVAADGLVIPMAPEILSLLGVSQIRETIDTVRRCYNSPPAGAGHRAEQVQPALHPQPGGAGHGGADRQAAGYLCIPVPHPLRRGGGGGSRSRRERAVLRARLQGGS